MTSGRRSRQIRSVRIPVPQPTSSTRRAPAPRSSETTANQLAWAWERLVRNPAAYERLRNAVRSDEDAEDVIESTITEAMRVRPVIPITGRRV